MGFSSQDKIDISAILSNGNGGSYNSINNNSQKIINKYGS
jgi:hypothetical protein